MPSPLRQRQIAINLGLLGLVVLLGITVWKVTRPTNPSGHELIPGFKDLPVEQIHIIRRRKPPLLLISRKNNWYLKGPVQARANPLLIQAILALPQLRPPHRYRINGLDLRQYGLNPPQMTIQYGKGNQIELGKINPINHLQYVRVTNHVYLIQGALAGLNQSGSLSWVSLSLLPPQSRIERITLPNLSIQASPSGQWLISPQSKNFNSKQARTLIKAWTELSAYQVTKPRKKTTDSNHNANPHIRIDLKNGAVYSFDIISSTPELVLRRVRTGIDYHLPANTERKLLALEGGEDRLHPSRK